MKNKPSWGDILPKMIRLKSGDISYYFRGRCIQALTKAQEQGKICFMPSNLGMFILHYHAKNDYPCINCDHRNMKGNKINCLCERVEKWCDDLGKAILNLLKGEK